MNVITYQRVSTTAQQESNNGHLPRLLLQNFATKNGFNIIKEYTDTAPGCGNPNDREGWKNLIGFLNSNPNQIDGLIVYSLDRISRDKTITDKIIKDLLSQGIKLIEI